MADDATRGASHARSGAIGKRGEDLAAAWLRREGYAILARNWHCAYGELDLAPGYLGQILFLLLVRSVRDDGTANLAE